MVNWFQPPLQTKVEYRAGDTIIAVPPKSGTTWTMNIFHQLRSGGDSTFKDIYAEVPWPEFKERPDQPDEELLERWKVMPLNVPRGFKTHSQPGSGPGDFATFRDDLKYVVVMRNPEEAIVSFKPFLEAHSLKLWEFWNASEMRDQFMRPTFQEFFDDIVLKGFPGMPPEAVPPGGLLTMLFFGFVNGWWPLRNKPNVLFLHYNDMKRDHEGSVRKIANHLGYTPSKEQWANILEYTSFEWMKANEEKFEVGTLLPFPLLEKGAMVRKGQAGKAAEDGMTPEIAATIRQFAEMMVPDEQARKWLYEGGELPLAAPETAASAEINMSAVKEAFDAIKKDASPRDVIEESMGGATQ